ncbi:MAG: FHA domain-containing protein [Bacteriovoracaceae bacterium]|nr:FHA domain-containing protein [Bacteriovoracaceae bacterium]
MKTENGNSSFAHRDFYLKPLDENLAPVVFTREILTIGRSETCDIRINSSFLSFVHASIFIKDGKFNVSDLNSTNGTFVNGVKVSISPLVENDILSFGPIAFRLIKVNQKSSDPANEERLLDQKTVLSKIVESVPYAENDFGPPPLPTPLTGGLNQILSSSGPSNNLEQKLEEQTIQSRSRDFARALMGQKSVSSMKPVTPLDIIPELNYSEFIFEENIEREAFVSKDSEEVALEISHFHENFMISVDYFNEKSKVLYASGGNYKNTLYISFLGSYKRYPLVKFEFGSFFLLDLSEEFKISIFDKKGQLAKFDVDGGYIKLNADQVVMLENDGYYLMFKYAKAPPKTTMAPFFYTDSFFNTFLFSSFVLWSLLSGIMFFIPVPEKESIEIPLEVDRIIYTKEIKPKVLVREKSNPGSKNLGTKSDDNLAAKAGSVEPRPVPNVKPEPPAAVAPKIDPAPPKVVETPKKNKEAPPKPASAKLPIETKTAPKSQGPVEPSKIVKVSPDAKNETAPKLDLKSLQSKMTKTLDSVGSNSIVTSNSPDAVDAPVPPSVGVSEGQGGGKTVGVIKSSGTKNGTGLQAPSGNLGQGESLKGGTGANGEGNKIQGFGDVGTKTVVLGNLDPLDVQNVLRRYLPQFKFCYEKELERINKKISTTLILDFVINGEGLSKQEKFTSSNIVFSSDATSCFDNVLSGIQFPKPKGGGDVKIRQPLNMEPGF